VPVALQCHYFSLHPRAACRFPVPAMACTCLRHHCVQTGPGVNQGLPSAVRYLQRQTNNSPATVEVMNARSLASSPKLFTCRKFFSAREYSESVSGCVCWRHSRLLLVLPVIWLRCISCTGPFLGIYRARGRERHHFGRGLFPVFTLRL
jgi:hypothetical protein